MDEGIAWLWLILLVVGIVIAKVMQRKEQEKAEQARMRYEIVERDAEKEKEEAFVKQLNTLVPNQTTTSQVSIVVPWGQQVHYYRYYIWTSNNCLHLFPASRLGTTSYSSARYRMEDSKIVHTVIPVDKILCYRQIGEIYTTVEGSGGESAYSFFNGVHGKINPIKITTSVHDNRTTQLFYDDDVKDAIWVFKYEDYYTLKKVLPEKDYDVINSKGAKQTDTGHAKASSKQRMATLKELYEQELISKEEFEKKRAEIISEI